MGCKAREMTAEAIVSDNAAALLDEMKLMGEAQGQQGTRKVINSELWHACAGPLVSLPQPGSLVYYFPQGHSEQVTISTRKTANTHIANYPNLSSQLMCQVHNVTLHADKDTDEIFAQMSLQPVNSELDVFPIPDFGHTKSKQPTEFFCKNLTASDTSTHGGFSVPRRAAEKLFPQLDYTMQPPNQELVVRDLHDNLWTFRHIYRGQPKRHLLTTGWSLFVGAKRLKAGDSVLFIRDEKSQLLLGVRRANRQQTTSPSSVLSADSMHMGVLAAAAHAAASLSSFTVYYNPRSCPSEFIIPLAKYHKSAYTQVSIGMRFGMMFETDESTKRRYMGTIVGISDCDPLRWPHSKWRSLQVEWDEHGYGERPDRVSLWEIETPESLFIFPSHSSRLKRQCLPGFVVPGTGIGFGNMNHLSQTLENGNGIMHPVFSGLGSEQLMNVLLKPQAQIPESQLGFNQSIYANILQNLRGSDASRACPSALPSFSATRIPVHELMMQQQTLQQQNVTLQISKPRNFIEQQGVVDSEKNQFASLQEPNRQEQNVCSDRRNSSESRCASPLLSRNSSETVHEKSEVESLPLRNQVDEGFQENAPYMQHTVESLMEPSNYENLKASVSVNNRPQVKDPDEPSKTLQSQWIETAHSLDKNISNNLLACQGYRSQFSEHDWVLNSSCYQSFKTDSLILSAPESTTASSADISSIVNPETYNLVEKLQFSSFSDSQSPQCLPNFIQEFFGGQELNTGIVPFDVHELLSQEEEIALKDRSNSSKVKDLSDDSINQSVTYNNLPLENSNGSVLASSCVSSTVLEAIDTTRGSHFLFPSEELVGNFSLNQEIQSQVTSANLTESQVFSLQEIPDSSGGTSSVDFNTHGLSNRDQKKHLSQPPLRTYTKVQKLGSVGRSIDVTRFRNYHELTSAIACMFGLQGQLDDHRGSDWKLVYVDYENDVLLVGDDPWEEFVNCVRCIRILSPTEVQQMIHEGMQLMNNYIPPPSE